MQSNKQNSNFLTTNYSKALLNPTLQTFSAHSAYNIERSVIISAFCVLFLLSLLQIALRLHRTTSICKNSSEDRRNSRFLTFTNIIPIFHIGTLFGSLSYIIAQIDLHGVYGLINNIVARLFFGLGICQLIFMYAMASRISFRSLHSNKKRKMQQYDVFLGIIFVLALVSLLVTCVCLAILNRVWPQFIFLLSIDICGLSISIYITSTFIRIAIYLHKIAVDIQSKQNRFRILKRYVWFVVISDIVVVSIVLQSICFNLTWYYQNPDVKLIYTHKSKYSHTTTAISGAMIFMLYCSFLQYAQQPIFIQKQTKGSVNVSSQYKRRRIREKKNRRKQQYQKKALENVKIQDRLSLSDIQLEDLTSPPLSKKLDANSTKTDKTNNNVISPNKETNNEHAQINGALQIVVDIEQNQSSPSTIDLYQNCNFVDKTKLIKTTPVSSLKLVSESTITQDNIQSPSMVSSNFNVEPTAPLNTMPKLRILNSGSKKDICAYNRDTNSFSA